MQFSLPFASNNKKNNVYFGLFIKESEVIGYIIEQRGKSLEIIADEQITFTTGWDSIIENVDELLFSLEQRTKKHIDKVIFFVYSHFVDQHNHDLKKSYLTIFKNLAKHLELKPLGYIECYEAVANYYEQRDQSPLTAILVELDKSNIGLFVYKGGHKSFVRTTERTDNIVHDLETIFTEIKGEVMLPSRVVLYDTDDLHESASNIIAHRWSSDLFVQDPRVEILKQEQLSAGLVNVFASQVGEISDKDMQTPINEKKEVLGFTIGEEVAVEKEPIHLPKVGGILKSVKNIFSKLKSMGKIKKNYGLGIVGILLIISALFIGEFFFHKAAVTVLFPAKNLSKSVDVTIPLTGQDNQEIQVKSATLSSELSEKKTTTGKRDVGDKARGEVTLHNFDDKDRIFSKGTQLEVNAIKFVLDDEIKVASASETTVNGSPVKMPGKSKGKVSASDIGSEANIAKGQRFKIGDLSSSTFFGINDSAFTGGTKKQVKTVSKQDVQELKDSVLKKAKAEAVQKIASLSSNEEVLINSLTVTELENIHLSKEVGDEATEVEIKVNAETQYYSYSPGTIRTYLKKTLEAEVPAGFRLDEGKILFEAKNIKKSEDEITMTIESNVIALKDISKPQIIDKVFGKKKNNIEAILKNEFGASGYEIKTESPIFFLDSWLPFFKKNISLKVSSL